MSQRNFQVTPAQADELFTAYLQSDDGETRTRYQAVRMYGMSYPLREIQKLTGCSRARLSVWCQHYQHLGIAGLVDRRTGGNSSKLTLAQREEIKTRLHQYTPRDLFGLESHTERGQFWTVEDLQRAVHQWYRVNYQCRQSYQRLLRESGFSYQRPAKVFKSQRVRQIAEFEEQVEKN